MNNQNKNQVFSFIGIFYILLFIQQPVLGQNNFTATKYDVEGYWMSQGSDVLFQIIVDEHQNLTGRIIWMSDSIDAIGNLRRDVRNSDVNYRSRLLKGTPVFYDYKYYDKDNSWVNGTIYNYKNGTEYHGKLWVDEKDNLNLKGYWGWLWFLSKTQKFKRIFNKEHIPIYTKEN